MNARRKSSSAGPPNHSGASQPPGRGPTAFRPSPVGPPPSPDSRTAADSLVLDPSGPLHGEPDRLLLEEIPPATALRPVLDTIGAGAHRISEIAGRLGRPASSLSKSLASLVEMGFVRRETPFGADPRSGKRSLYRINDSFMRLWFRVVALHRAALANAPRETRLRYWHRHRPSLESHAWKELCRMAVPLLHRADTPLANLGPFEPAQRYWRGNAPEYDVVARSIDGRRLLVGETKWPAAVGVVLRIGRQRQAVDLPGATNSQIVHVQFVPDAREVETSAGVVTVDASTVMAVLR